MYLVDSGKEFCEAEEEVFDFNHSKIGAFIIKKWELPAYLENLILCHHQKFIDPEMGVHILRMTSLVQLADIISLNLGIGFKSPPKESIDVSQYKCLEVLNIPPDELQEIYTDTLKTFNEEKRFFN